MLYGGNNLDEVQDETGFLRAFVGSLIWEILYHEKELKLAHRHAGLVKDLVSEIAKRAGYEIDVDKITAQDYIDDDDDESYCADAISYLRYAVADEIDSVAHHEKALHEAHIALGFAKILVIRGQYEIDFDQVTAEQKERLAK